MAVLTAATRLFDEFSFTISRDEDRFLVGDLGFARIGFDLKFSKHAIPDDLEVELAHPRNDRLAGLLIGKDAESGVFLGEALQSIRHFLLIELGFWLDGHRNDRIRERRRLEEDREILITKRVAGGDVLDPDDRGDVTGETGVYVFAFVSLDLNEATDALALVGARIVNSIAFAQLAGIHPEKDELADKGVAPKLKGKRAELRVVIGRSLHRIAGIGVLAFGGRNIEGTWEIVDDGV